MGRKGAPSLFEFIHKDPASLVGPKAEGKPTVRVTTMPMGGGGQTSRPAVPQTEPKPVLSRGDPGPAHGISQGESESASILKREITLPLVPAAGIAVAILAAVALFTWVIAYPVGLGRGEKKILDRIPPIPEEQVAAGDSNPPERLVPAEHAGNRPGRGVDRPDPGREPSEPQHVRPGADPDVLTDTRRSGYNYYRLTTDVRSEAIRAAQFLAEHNMDAMAVPDPKNSAGKWAVYARRGIPSGGFSEHAEASRTLKDRVARLGGEWTQNHRGSSDFGDAFWELYKPSAR